MLNERRIFTNDKFVDNAGRVVGVLSRQRLVLAGLMKEKYSINMERVVFYLGMKLVEKNKHMFFGSGGH